MYTLVHFKPQENKDGGVQRYPMKSKVAGPLPNFGEIEPGSLVAEVNVGEIYFEKYAMSCT